MQFYLSGRCVQRHGTAEQARTHETCGQLCGVHELEYHRTGMSRAIIIMGSFAVIVCPSSINHWIIAYLLLLLMHVYIYLCMFVLFVFGWFGWAINQ